MTKNPIWGGRFEGEPSDLLRAFNDSFAFDYRLFSEDVRGSLAWAEALERAGIVTHEEAAQLSAALQQIPAPKEFEEEDVHSYVEARLRERIGPLAGKLHTGRSRNDQVATDLKLWLKDACAEGCYGVHEVMTALARHAGDEAATPMPGYTHSKQAEPVTFGHWCLAYCEMLLRDWQRFGDAQERGDECPLGCGALAGTPLNIDRDALAKSLNFARATANSIDSVADRDFAAEYLFASALLLSHLSRLAEDLIFFTSDESNYAELPDALATGSSRMPQKKNPDVLELLRGHAGRAIGELTGLLAVMKGIPLAYDKDLQLDKEPLFRMRATLAAALPALAALLGGLKLNRDRMRAAAQSPMLMATAVADAMSAKGTPFREAHERVGRELASIEKLAKEHGVTLESILAKKNALGGTSPARVKEAAAAMQERLR
ncbi:MAG TPA: argininosuccinate lyase [Thermoanaerobaculia bacterium]|nr:argininosuccinate lyase [Thermoanaerobaculia bacterium]